MRSTLRNHERQTRQQSRLGEPLTHIVPSAAQSPLPSSSPFFASRLPHSSPATATTMHRKPIGASIGFPTTANPVAQKPVRGSSSITRQQSEAPTPEKPRRREKKGLVTMYREAPPSDGEMIGAVVKEGWKGWQEKRKKEEAEKEAARENLGLKRVENGKSHQPRPPPAATSASSSASSRDHKSCPSSRPTASRAGTTLHEYSNRTAYAHENTRPDDLDDLVSKVADKLSHWGKGISERSAGAKEKKMEERQRQERKALKMSISSPRPADSSSARPSFSSEGSVRSLLGAGKTGGSMADRMAKRDGSNFEIPFWPRGKKDRSTASSAKGSPQHTLPHGDERVTQFGDFIEPELVSAPWNQQVTKGSPFSSPYSSRSSVDKQGSDSRSSSPSAKFFGRFIPSPTSLFGTGSQIRPPRTQRRGSDDSFFGCQGISVEEENAAQHLVQQDGHDGHIESLDFRAPPTLPHGAREHFGRNPPGLGQSGGGGGGGGGRGDDDDDDAHKRSPLATNEGVARVSPLLRDTQHRPMVSDQGVDRRSVAPELVSQRQRRNGGDHDAREPRGDDHRVSWWDPPSPQPPCRPVTSSKKGKEKASGDGGLQAGAQKPRKGSGEPETENHTYWKDYRKKLRGTNFSRGSGWEDGKPF